MKPLAVATLFCTLAFSQVPSPTPDSRDTLKLRTSLERAQTTLQDWANLHRYREDEILPSDNCGFPATTRARD